MSTLAIALLLFCAPGLVVQAANHGGQLDTACDASASADNLSGSNLLQVSSSGLSARRLGHKEADKSTLFYHVHIPRTGGTTVASLLDADVCSPYESGFDFTYDSEHTQCTKTCEMGLTDNSRTCFPGRLDFEHQFFRQNFQRSVELMATTGAESTIFVTTLRRGSDRMKSQWALEEFDGRKRGPTSLRWQPPDGVGPFSNESLQLYITGGPHTGEHWDPGGLDKEGNTFILSTSQRGNLQVAQLASLGPDTPIVTRQHLEMAKEVLMTGKWIIGFTKCLDKLQEKLHSYAELLHEGIPAKVLERKSGLDATSQEASKFGRDLDIMSSETIELLDQQCALDNELFEWAWARAKEHPDERFAGTC